MAQEFYYSKERPKTHSEPKALPLKHMKKLIIKILKTIFSDARQVIIGVIVLALFGGTTGVLYLSKTALAFSISILTIPTPLWATIALVLLLVLYVQLKGKKSQSSMIPLFSACGAFWDSKFNMYCLSCMKSLKNSTISTSIFFCSDPKCNSKHPLKDDSGRDITKQEAIDIIKTSVNNRLNPPVNSEVTDAILNLYVKTDEIVLNLKKYYGDMPFTKIQIESGIAELNQMKILLPWTSTGDYGLTDRGKKLLAEKK